MINYKGCFIAYSEPVNEWQATDAGELIGTGKTVGAAKGVITRYLNSSRYPVEHHDGTVDKRYTVDYEYCGYNDQRAVVRFCGNWIEACQSYDDAIIAARIHNRNRI